MNDTGEFVLARPFDEVGEFVATLRDVSASRLTACRGWTVHEVIAHVAAGSQEIADLIEDRLAGAAPRATKAFEERESPYRAMTDGDLRRCFFVQVTRSREARQRLAEQSDDAVLFTGQLMSSSELLTHSRSERAIHRWDIIGRDEIGWPMLAQPDLTVHAVKILSEMTELNETLDNRLRAAHYRGEGFVVRLRSEPHDDAVVTHSDGVVSIALEPPGDERADVHLDPAARLLALWGRREPSASIRVERSVNRVQLNSLFGW